MDFKQIEAFVNVAKYKSFSKAAEAIYLSQPTVSSHIASLEQELNVLLFDRSGKEVRLTHAGSIFLEFSINMINIRNSAISSLAELDKKIGGKLVIASSTTPCRFLIPPILKSFYDIYPNVCFDVKEENTKNAIEMVLSGNADVGIVGEIINDSKLSYTKIATDNLVLISNKKDLPDSISLNQLFNEKFVLREKGSATRSVLEKALELNGLSADKLKIFAEVSSLEAVLQLVKNDAGVSIVSELACQDYINAKIIKKHNIDNFNITRGIYAVIHTKRVLSPSGKAFYHHITSTLINNS